MYWGCEVWGPSRVSIFASCEQLGYWGSGSAIGMHEALTAVGFLESNLMCLIVPGEIRTLFYL